MPLVVKALVVSSIALSISVSGPRGQAADLQSTESVSAPPPLNWTTQQDHKNMMQQLGITRLRPGPSGRPGTDQLGQLRSCQSQSFP